MKINFSGTSMYPCLRAGDLLSYVPYDKAKVRVGDVVLFYPPDRKHPVAHRLVSFDAAGFRTQGDNSSFVDRDAIKSQDVLGRVVSVERHHKTISISGGLRGRLIGLNTRVSKKIKERCINIFHPVYRYLSQIELYHRLGILQNNLRLLCFKRVNGIEMQLRMGERIIGKRLPGQTRWDVKRPFKLLISESSLRQKEMESNFVMQNRSLRPDHDESNANING